MHSKVLSAALEIRNSMDSLMDTPRLYILACHSFDLGEANQFLADRFHGWADSSGTTAAERLIEFSGWICYMSFRKDITAIRHPHDT